MKVMCKDCALWGNRNDQRTSRAIRLCQKWNIHKGGDDTCRFAEHANPTIARAIRDLGIG
jgi:hypothetical protein